MKKNYNISFAEYHIKNTDPNFLEKYWSDKNTLNPWEIGSYSNKKVWIYCQEKEYHNDYGGYQISCNHFTQGGRCSYCAKRNSKGIHPKDSFAQWGINKFGVSFLDKYWDYEQNNKLNINPWKLSIHSNKYVYIMCQKHSYHGSYKTRINDFVSKDNQEICGLCTRRRGKVHYFDSIGFLYHDVAKMIVEDERNNLTYMDTYSIAPFTTKKKYYYKCLNCGTYSDKKLPVQALVKNNYSCSCHDGISIPNKFMYNLLTQLKIDFKKEYMPGWIEGYEKLRYDFYIPSLNLIIEMDGGMGHGNDHTKWSNPNRDSFIDRMKDEYANNNGINVIRIDSTKSDLLYLKNNCTKQLNGVLNLNNLNWKNIWLKCQKSIIYDVVELYNKNIQMKEISNILKLEQSTIINYLKRADYLGLCKYKKYRGKSFLSNDIINLRRKGLSINEIANKLNISVKTVKKYIRLAQNGEEIK